MNSGIPLQQAAASLVAAGHDAYARGWLPATSGNLSCRLNTGEVAITVSGRHKGQLVLDDIMRVGMDGEALEDKLPSAETRLHTQLYRLFPEIAVVLHVHSVHATVLSRMGGDAIPLSDFELLKAFPGIESHAVLVHLAVFPNDQDIPRLASRVEAHLPQAQLPGYLIAGHGLYCWGQTMADAQRHLEAFDFLFQCELALRRTTHP